MVVTLVEVFLKLQQQHTNIHITFSLKIISDLTYNGYTMRKSFNNDIHKLS